MTNDSLVLYQHPAAAAVEKQLQLLSPQFAQVLGSIMEPARLVRTVMVSLDRTPTLYECNRQSLFMAAMSAACLGLEVDGVTGQAFLLPFAGKAQLITGYKGYNTLAGRGGYAIRGACVREGDGFEYDLASATIVHRPKLGNGGRVVGAWALAASKSLPAVASVISIDELLALKARAPGARKRESPWNDPEIGFPAMCEKTAKRRLARSMPLNLLQSVAPLHKLHYAARMDEAVEEQGRPAWVSPDKGVVVDEAEVVESPLPPRTVSEPIVVDGGKAACEWPELPVATAKRVAAMLQFVRSSATVAVIDSKWKHRSTRALMEEVRIASPADFERISETFNTLRSELALRERDA